MGLVTEAAAAAGQQTPLASRAQAVYQRGRKMGCGRKDDSIVFEVLSAKQ